MTKTYVTFRNATTALFLLAATCPCLLQAQSNADSIPFRRSSLYTFIVKTDKDSMKVNKKLDSSGNIALDVVSSFTDQKKETTAEDSIPKSELILQVFSSIEIPDQFNDHNLPTRIMDFDAFPVTAEEVEATNLATTGEKKKSGFSKFMKTTGNIVASTVTAGSVAIDTTVNVNTYLPAVLNKFFIQENTPALLVGKWYNYTGEKKENSGTETCYYDMNLIGERGLYNASTADIEAAQSSATGLSRLRDAGEDLIPNTFVMALYLEYKSTKEIMKQAQDAMTVGAGVASLFGVNSDLVLLGTQAAGAAAGAAVGDGYAVQVHSYLYQLEWNKEIENEFYQNYYFNKSLDDLIASGICKLNFVGKDKAFCSVRNSRFSKKPESELIKRATTRAIDAVIVKLQQEHDVFKTKAPISKIDKENGMLFAKIGMKEGIEKGDTYDVLQPTMDPETQKITYEVVGKVKATEQIYDNRYDAETELQEDVDNGGKEGPTFSETAFKGKVKEDWRGCLLKLKSKK